MRLIVKPIPCKPENLKTHMGDTARLVIQQLLVALSLHNFGSDVDVEATPQKRQIFFPSTSKTPLTPIIPTETVPVRPPFFTCYLYF